MPDALAAQSVAVPSRFGGLQLIWQGRRRWDDSTSVSACSLRIPRWCIGLLNVVAYFWSWDIGWWCARKEMLARSKTRTTPAPTEPCSQRTSFMWLVKRLSQDPDVSVEASRKHVLGTAEECHGRRPFTMQQPDLEVLQSCGEALEERRAAGGSFDQIIPIIR